MCFSSVRSAVPVKFHFLLAGKMRAGEEGKAGGVTHAHMPALLMFLLLCRGHVVLCQTGVRLSQCDLKCEARSCPARSAPAAKFYYQNLSGSLLVMCLRPIRKMNTLLCLNRCTFTCQSRSCLSADSRRDGLKSEFRVNQSFCECL